MEEKNKMDDPNGVGSQLKKMFSFFMLHATPDCPCHQHAEEYDRLGPDECLTRMEIILNRLSEESRKRRIPFHRWTAERFVRIAIWKARKGKPL